MSKIYMTLDNNRKFIGICKSPEEGEKKIRAYIASNNKLALTALEKPCKSNSLPSWVNDKSMIHDFALGMYSETMSFKGFCACEYLKPLFIDVRPENGCIIADVSYYYVWQRNGLTVEVGNSPKNYSRVDFIDGQVKFEIVQ